MPIYEFTCPNNHAFEVVLGYDDPRLTHCDECGEELRRVYSTPAVILRGPGFYLTDNRKQDISGGIKNVPRSGT